MKKFNKNFCKNICSNITFGSAVLTALFHFVFCGIPALIGILSVVFGTFALSPVNFITSQQRTYLLIVSGFLIITSFLLYRKEKCYCCFSEKELFLKKIVLMFSSGLFLIGLVFHLISIMFLTTPSCH